MPQLPAGADDVAGAPGTRRELVPFVVVGVLATAVDFGLFNLFLRAGWPVWLANAVALVVSMTVAFAGNYRWTFAHREIRSLWHAYATFAAINIAAVLFIEAVVVAAAWGFAPGELVLNLVKALATVVATVVRFLAYRRWVFF